MKCPNCAVDNKDSAKACKRCGKDLALPQAWFPDFKWHAKTLGVLYALIAVFYLGVSFALRQLPKPYNFRTVPAELTPWLKKG